MKILLHNPDDGVTQSLMPRPWIFLLQALAPPEPEVFLIGGSAQPISGARLAGFVRRHGIGPVGIGAMTRMIAKADRVARRLAGGRSEPRGAADGGAANSAFSPRRRPAGRDRGPAASCRD